jgi:Ni/Fe-hydrogenase 1 B-type cytochrome subunit
MSVKTLRRIYVWEWPVRFFHWINVVCLVLLCISGFIIGNPPAIIIAKEATHSYWFGIVRFIHFAVSYIFLFNFIIRIYWSIVGNKYANWKELVPTSKKFWTEMMKVIKIDILFMKGKESFHVGHNQLAGFSYFITFILLLLQVITGFGLYVAMSDAWLPQLFSWVPYLFGGEFSLRLVHHICMWAFIIFAMIHIHLVIYHDVVEGRGETSSMVSGWKFIEEDTLEAEEREKKNNGAQSKLKMPVGDNEKDG